jgi:hypothetical protein
MPPERIRNHYQHVTQFERGRIIGMREVGLSYRAIAHRVRRNVATVLRCCRAWFEEGRHQRVRGTGPRRRTTDRPDLGMHDGRRRVRRLRGERRYFAFSVERPVARTVGVMVWGAIYFGSRSRLVFIQGNLTAIRYVQEVLRPVVVPYFRRVNNALFQQDNARPLR